MFRKIVLAIFIFVAVTNVRTTPIPSDEETLPDATPTHRSETSTENVELSTEKVDTSSVGVDVESDSPTQKSSTDSRYSVRDFYRRRRQKNVDTTSPIDARPRVAKNQVSVF